MLVLLVIVVFFWVFIVVYGLVIIIKSIIDEWEEDEWVVNCVIFLLFGFWVISVVVCLLYLIFYSLVWFDLVVILVDGRYGFI